MSGAAKEPLKISPCSLREGEKKVPAVHRDCTLCSDKEKEHFFCSPLIFVFQWYLGIFFLRLFLYFFTKITDWQLEIPEGLGCGPVAEREQ